MHDFPVIMEQGETGKSDWEANENATHPYQYTETYAQLFDTPQSQHA